MSLRNKIWLEIKEHLGQKYQMFKDFVHLVVNGKESQRFQIFVILEYFDTKIQDKRWEIYSNK